MNPVDLYNDVVQRVSAYRAFLKQEIGSVPQVKTMADFEQLPFMDKSNYIMKYPVAELCLDGDPSCAHLWLRSSGTSKKPFFWPRRYEDEMHFPKGMKALFKDYVTPGVQPTLIVVALALGPWGTGMQTSFAFRILAQETPGLAVVSPGLQTDSVIEVLERLSPQYKQTLLLSYPPFAKNMLEQAAARGVDLKALNIHTMVGGEGITESFRERMWDLLGHGKKDLNKVWSLYGSTDFANVGFENPLTIAVRRLITQYNLWEEIFGNADVPMLFQQTPAKTIFEQVDGELVVSRLQAIPLVRYRSGDHVKFMQKSQLLSRLRGLGHDAETVVQDCNLTVPQWETPFIALYGRLDHAVFFYGAKINVEQVKTALNTKAMGPYFNGLFLIKGIEDHKGNPLLELSLEESEILKKTDLLALAETFALELEKVQSEFREVRTLAPKLRHVRIVAKPASVFELGWKTRHM